MIATQTTINVTRNGKTDTDFYKAIRRAEHRRYAKRLAGVAIKSVTNSTLKYVERAFADIRDHDEHTDVHMAKWRAYYGVETQAQLLARLRNELGQFV